MSQHDYSIANQLFPAFRADLNLALAAIVSLNSGTTAPTTTAANMPWYDTSEHKIKIRNEADTGWITLYTIDTSNNTISVGDSSSFAGTTTKSRELFSTPTTVATGATGTECGLSETIANFDYIDIYYYTHGTTQDYATVTFRRRLLSASQNNQRLTVGKDANETLAFWGSGTSLFLRRYGTDRIVVTSIVGRTF